MFWAVPRFPRGSARTTAKDRSLPRPSPPATAPMSSSRTDFRKYNARSSFRGVVMFLSDMVALSVYCFLAVWFQTWWLQLIFSFIAGSVIAIFFVVAHDAAHDALTPNRWLNRWIGRIAFLPSLHPYS